MGPREAQVCLAGWNPALVIPALGTLRPCPDPSKPVLIAVGPRRCLDQPPLTSPSFPPAVSAAPPLGPPLQLPPSPDPSSREPAHSDPLDAASSSSSSSSCPPCSPEPGREAPGPEPMAAAAGSSASREGRGEKGHLYCPTCKVTVNSASQLQAHNTG